MKKSWDIYTYDVKNISTNWVMAILIGGLILLPSLYAWLNIKASWDPYGQTDQIPVGVVNEDEGVTVRDQDIHVGHDLVDTLRKDDSFQWHFVSREKAMDEVEYGHYYAVIVIPEDFSKQLGTVISDHPEKATVEYYVNEKINAIAPKITEKGASVIVEQISSNFVSVVNGIIFGIFNRLGIELEKDLPDIERFKDYVFTLEKNLPVIKDKLEGVNGDARKAEELIAKARQAIPTAKKATEKGLDIISDTSTFLDNAEQRLNDISPKVKKDLDSVQKVANEVDEFISHIQSAHIDFSPGQTLTNQVNNRIDEAIGLIDLIQNNLIEAQNKAIQSSVKEQNGIDINQTNVLKFEQGRQSFGQLFVKQAFERGRHNLNYNMDHMITQTVNQSEKTALYSMNDALKQTFDQGNKQQSARSADEIFQTLNQLVLLLNQSTIVQTDVQEDLIVEANRRLNNVKQNLQNIKEHTNKLNDFLGSQEQYVEQMLADLKQLSVNTSNRIDSFVQEYNETIEPTIRKQVSQVMETLTKTQGILTDIQETIPAIEQMLNEAEVKLGQGKDALNKALNEYPYVSGKVNRLADRIRELNEEADINDIIELLRNDPKAERGFFAEPVVLNENKLFPIKNYGTGMTPFYTVLAIWVGGLLLISLLSTDVHHHLEKVTEKDMYFGRLFTFMTIAMFQTLIVTLGDMLLIGVDIKEPLWFILFGLLISTVFIVIVYSFVAVFGDVGKALAIIMLVLQIAGSGGTYPVVLLPEFFQIISPFLPFTYAVDLMREAVGGIVWERAIRDIIFLIIFGLLGLLLGAILKGPISKYTKILKEKSKESGLMH